MRDAHQPPAFDSPLEEAEFLEAFLRDQVECLFDLSPDCDDIAAWVVDEDTGTTSFIRVCERLDAEPRTIRREILREFHRRNLRRLAERGKAWERVRDWYLRPTAEDRFLRVMAAATGSTESRLARDAFDVISDPRSFVDTSQGLGDLGLRTHGTRHAGASRNIKEAA